jgi:hypothetical protein
MRWIHSRYPTKKQPSPEFTAQLEIESGTPNRFRKPEKLEVSLQGGS